MWTELFNMSASLTYNVLVLCVCEHHYQLYVHACVFVVVVTYMWPVEMFVIVESSEQCIF